MPQGVSGAVIGEVNPCRMAVSSAGLCLEQPDAEIALASGGADGPPRGNPRHRLRRLGVAGCMEEDHKQSDECPSRPTTSPLAQCPTERLNVPARRPASCKGGDRATDP